MKFPGLPVLILLASLATWPVSGQLRIQPELDTTDILIGDHILLRLFLGLDEGVSIEGVGVGPLVDSGIELVQEAPLQQANERSAYQDLILSVYDSGRYLIPPLPVVYRQGGQLDTAYSPPLPFSARTILLPGDSVALQPIKPIVEEPLKLEDLWPYLAAALGLAALVALILIPWRRRRQKSQAPEPAYIHKPAHEIARESLAELGSRGLWQAGEVKLYYSELTQILRTYLEQRFDIRARERTTAEILSQLDKADVEESELRHLLHLADLVKFARAEPQDEIHHQSMERVRRFVDQTADESVTVAIPAS